MKMDKELTLERMKHEAEVEIEKERQQNEKTKLELQKPKLDLINKGKLSSDAVIGRGGSVASVVASSSSFDIIGNLGLLPKLNEKDPDTERVADTRGWPDAECTLILQCVFTGKAQEANSSLC